MEFDITAIIVVVVMLLEDTGLGAIGASESASSLIRESGTMVRKVS